METILSVCLGMALSAACGFRIFVPLLFMSVAAHSGHLQLAQSFAWIGSPAAITAFSIATILEIGAYYIPWLDHFLDTMATPAAIVAGTVVTASVVTDMSPFLRWTLAVIAGGGAAGVVQGITVMARAVSGVTTGGLGNPLVATAELGGALLTSAISIVAPLLAIFLVAIVFGAMALKLLRKRSQLAL